MTLLSLSIVSPTENSTNESAVASEAHWNSTSSD